MALNTPPTLLGVSGRMGEPERTEEHTRGTRARGRRRQAKCQCRRTEPEALKYITNYRNSGLSPCLFADCQSKYISGLAAFFGKPSCSNCCHKSGRIHRNNHLLRLKAQIWNTAHRLVATNVLASRNSESNDGLPSQQGKLGVFFHISC